MRKFQKKTENFRCLNCDKEVVGNGFTNHCPKCFWSKHVDIFPGDRNSNCSGPMELIDLFKKDRKFSLIHKCRKCGIEKKNKVSDKDELGDLIETIKKSHL